MSRHYSYIGLGSNLDNPKLQLQQALDEIAQLPGCDLLANSSFYASKPQGPQDQPDFVNAVCLIGTELSPQQLLEALQSIEQQHGRVKKRHWGERCIDLDILLYDDLVMQTDQLVIPHPYMTERDFVLIPLAEIDKDVRIPNKGGLTALIDKLTTSYLITI
ncbi:2-amino-4-hydroxy-6-hydroxymethyldihydropteridine diphosphokinase [Thiomicrorhabdus sediminis]|uniref:2-amino-4-hydroxy-6-hydroxymethyldihydropteridine pyrophosphokinase n=1 Tax=Thiomicrorhabdus sediminis TaxID=2580412 RepID=A0A4P9K6K6_9GAMM|nr:2-amino-4-hydroxy-6-hydroxymethyldihydropteridine diphosphokinase [Thiomicrorhabdus sediminis]QCU90518.1 2-amino-4-hydroxy-6-hydroxymethyldihydropteridine diphosphokinase [Thiomicrorhabdus sediminis]